VSKTADIVKGIDHLIVMIGDLDRSERTWRALGFHLTPRGFHQTGGTANHLIMLDRAYIELLGLADASAASPYRATMEKNPGLSGVALRGSADDTYRFWREQGLEPAPVEKLARGVEIDGRADVARFELTRLPHSAELPFLLFCCDHRTPQFVWQANTPPHPNGARRLEELIVVIDDAATVTRFERLTGGSVSNSVAGNSFALGESRVTFLSPDAFLRRFGPEANFRLGTLPTLAAFVLTSSDVSRARQFAQTAGWRVLDTDSGRFVVHVPSEGVLIEWVPTT
jgi:catechol 2,3-dioxygenase-like lactoylglutathione lyase family enzyme